GPGTSVPAGGQPHRPPRGPAAPGDRRARPGRQPAARRHATRWPTAGVAHPAEGGGVMTATLTETILAVDGVRSPMLQAGPLHAERAVVFVHGNPGSSQDWARLVERTGALARAVAWDHPGFGQADKRARLGAPAE